MNHSPHRPFWMQDILNRKSAPRNEREEAGPEAGGKHGQDAMTDEQVIVDPPGRVVEDRVRDVHHPVDDESA